MRQVGPVLFALADGPGRAPAPASRSRRVEYVLPPLAEPNAAPHSAPLSDAIAEMMLWSPWNAAAVSQRPQAGRAAPPVVRLELTLDDAENLADNLSALIALVQARQDADPPASPAMLGFAGIKIGAEPKAAAPRFSPAQLDAISNLPLRRGLSRGADGIPRRSVRS